MAKKLIIDWKEYNQIVEKLAIQIYDSGFKPNLLIGIMRGGAPIIDVLSRVFKLKCAYLAVESYSGKNIEDHQGELIFSRELSSTAQEMKSIKTAVLWKKAISTFEPDFCAQKLKDNPWIVQPFEKYEEIRIEDLKKNQR